MEEMRQSVRIVQQCLARLPEGPVMAKVPKVIKPPKGEIYFSVEGPKGELGYYVVSDGGANPYRLHVRPSCFINLQALPEMVRGQLVADLIAVIGTLDIVLGRDRSVGSGDGESLVLFLLVPLVKIVVILWRGHPARGLLELLRA